MQLFTEIGLWCVGFFSSNACNSWSVDLGDLPAISSISEIRSLVWSLYSQLGLFSIDIPGEILSNPEAAPSRTLILYIPE